MPSDGVFYRWVPREINPPEAQAIGIRLFAAAAGLGIAAALLEWKRDVVGQTWCGKAQSSFYETRGFGKAPSRVRDLSETIENHSKQVREITVTVWEQVPIPPEEIRWE